MTMTRKTEDVEETPCPSATVSTTNVTWTGLESNPGLRSARTVRRLQLEYQYHVLNMAAPVEGTVSFSSVELAQCCMWKAPDCRYTSRHMQYGVHIVSWN